MTQVYENPMGTDGFEFVEYAAPDPRLLHALFRNMGFTAVARHRKKRISLYRQNDINFLVNEEPGSFAVEFAKKHGPCACGFAMRVKDSKKAFTMALDKGAKKFSHKSETVALDTPMIEGIGGSILYMVEGYDRGDVYAAEYDYLRGEAKHPKGLGLTYIDHLTHNVNQGEMNTWAGYYERLFNFHENRTLFPRHGQPRRQGAHPAERIRRRQIPDRRVPAPVPGRRHPARRPVHRQRVRHCGSHEAQPGGVPGYAGRLLRDGG